MCWPDCISVLMIFTCGLLGRLWNKMKGRDKKGVKRKKGFFYSNGRQFMFFLWILLTNLCGLHRGKHYYNFIVFAMVHLYLHGSYGSSAQPGLTELPGSVTG